MWDYDRGESNQFIGEVLIDLSEALLDNMLHWYPLHLHNYQATPLPTPTPMLSPQNFRDPATIQRYSGKRAVFFIWWKFVTFYESTPSDNPPSHILVFTYKFIIVVFLPAYIQIIKKLI